MSGLSEGGERAEPIDEDGTQHPHVGARGRIGDDGDREHAGLGQGVKIHGKIAGGYARGTMRVTVRPSIEIASSGPRTELTRTLIIR